MSRMNGKNFNGGSSHWGDQTGNWRARVDRLVAENCTTKSRDSTRVTSNRTQVKAHFAVMTLFEWLRKDLGFAGLSNPRALDERHFHALATQIRARKEAGEIGASHAACFATYSRHLARWIGKPEMASIFDQALGKDVCKRQLVADHDKSWQAAGIDIEKKFVEILEYELWVGLVLVAQHHFGLRKTEALMLQPLRDIQPIAVTYPPSGDSPKRSLSPRQLVKLPCEEWVGGVNIYVNDGAKGGRRRVVEITDAEAVGAASLLREQILALDDREKLTPPWNTLQKNARIYDRVLERFGITKNNLGVTGHGLRAGFACDMLESFGITPTVRGGDGQHLDPLRQRVAYKRTTEAMGHGRVSVVGAYAGSVTPQMAARLKKAAERQALLTASAQGPSAAEEMAELAKNESGALPGESVNNEKISGQGE